MDLSCLVGPSCLVALSCLMDLSCLVDPSCLVDLSCLMDLSYQVALSCLEELACLGVPAYLVGPFHLQGPSCQVLSSHEDLSWVVQIHAVPCRRVRKGPRYLDLVLHQMDLSALKALAVEHLLVVLVQLAL